MKLNAKGQVTIPAALRYKYGLAVGDDLDVVDVGGGLRIIHRVELAPGQRAVLQVRGTARPGPSTDEILTLTRGNRAPDAR